MCILYKESIQGSFKLYFITTFMRTKEFLATTLIYTCLRVTFDVITA